MMNFPLFIQTKLRENGFPNFSFDTNQYGSSSGQLGGFYLKTQSLKYWPSDIQNQLNIWRDEWNTNHSNEQVLEVSVIDFDWDDDRTWEASCHFYLK